MFFLFDCDNFFVSCERVFAPGLKKRPVVVLSNNDGCVVSRSYEAKALGIPMGAPYFKIERFFTARGGVALSSNYELYADMSARVMSVLRSCFSNLEVYSIDEAFARLPDSQNLEQLAAAIRTRILRETGISVSAGIAPTKTLCKIAAHCAKQKTADKTFTLKDPEQIRKHLQQLDVIDIWGVGRHLSPKLGYLGIFTAWELAQTPLQQIRRCFNLRLAQTVLELNGTPCLELETEETAQSLTTSRSFEYEIKDYELLRKILAEFADAVSIRLRRQNAVAGTLSVFLRTNRFAAGEQYNNAAFVLLRLLLPIPESLSALRNKGCGRFTGPASPTNPPALFSTKSSRSTVCKIHSSTTIKPPEKTGNSCPPLTVSTTASAKKPSALPRRPAASAIISAGTVVPALIQPLGTN